MSNEYELNYGQQDNNNDYQSVGMEEYEYADSDAYQLAEDGDFQIEQLEDYQPVAVDESDFAGGNRGSDISNLDYVMEEVNREEIPEALVSDEEYEDIDVAFSEVEDSQEDIRFSDIEISKEEARGTIPYRDLRDMCVQFSKINESGVSAIDTVRIIREQTTNTTLKSALESIYNQIKNGEDLSDAMTNCGCFPFALTVAVSAAEKNDLVALAFKRFGDIYDREDEQKDMQNKYIFYPALVTICSIAVMVIMMLIVYPSFVNMFTGLDADLPQLSKGLLAVATWLRKIWWVLIILLVLILLLIFIYKKASKANLFGQKLGSRSIPEGSFRRMNLYAKFARYMNGLLEVGVSEKDALFVTARSFTEYPFMTSKLLDAANAASNGSTLSNALCVFDFFPIMILQMISVGEEMGDTPMMLMHIADYYEEEARKDANRRSMRREPIAIIVMVIVVLFLLLSMLQPVLKFYELVNQM